MGVATHEYEMYYAFLDGCWCEIPYRLPLFLCAVAYQVQIVDGEDVVFYKVAKKEFLVNDKNCTLAFCCVAALVRGVVAEH